MCRGGLFLRRFRRRAVWVVTGSFGLILLLFTACGGGGGSPPGPVPDTVITGTNPARAFFNGGIVTISFTSNPGGATFECRVDAAVFAACVSAFAVDIAPLLEGAHTFDVQAVLGGQRDATPARFSFTVDRTAPGAPTANTAVSGDGVIVLKFTAPADSDLQSYRIYRATVPIADVTLCGCALEVIPSAGSSMEYRSKGLTNGTTYFHRITAIDKAGNEGAASGSLSGTPAEITVTNTATYPTLVRSAFGVDRFLTVWNTDINNNPLSPNYDVDGAFVSPDGYLLGPPFHIVTGAGDQTNPRVAFDTASNRFVVVWEDARAGNPDVYLARVALDGTVLDPGGVGVVTLPSSQNQPEIACSSQGCLILWVDNRNGPQELFATQFTGSVTPGSRLLPTSPLEVFIRPFVSASAGMFLITWSSNLDSRPYGVRYTWTGGVQDGAPVLLGSLNTRQERPISTPVNPGSAASSFLVVWEDFRANDPARNDIYASVVPAAGFPSSEIALSSGSPGVKIITYLTGSSDGSSAQIAWMDNRGPWIRVYRKAINLIPVPQAVEPELPGSTVDHLQRFPALAFGMGRFLLTFLDIKNNNPDAPEFDILAHLIDP